MSRKEQVARRNARIKKEFSTLAAIKEHGVRKHSIEWMYANLANKFYLAPLTIERIIQSKD